MGPAGEFRQPVWMLDPDVSPHDAAAGAPPPAAPESTFDPQALRARPRVRNTAVTAVLRRRGGLTGASRFAGVDRPRGGPRVRPRSLDQWEEWVPGRSGTRAGSR